MLEIHTLGASDRVDEMHCKEDIATIHSIHSHESAEYGVYGTDSYTGKEINIQTWIFEIKYGTRTYVHRKSHGLTRHHATEGN
ncbi:hypothetical protein ACN38_g3674 [Penicillium nordicum]|uniref:Uncharacterized protein n=1 Tax=Penicillium nordicum TaxID=229535 RepID=A0A0M9WHU5_9EURO|nr:hypothetical protein ACN38_g3674 [Penicillium nordicum]